MLKNKNLSNFTTKCDWIVGTLKHKILKVCYEYLGI